jgi:hypothetical protein
MHLAEAALPSPTQAKMGLVTNVGVDETLFAVRLDRNLLLIYCATRPVTLQRLGNSRSCIIPPFRGSSTNPTPGMKTLAGIDRPTAMVARVGSSEQKRRGIGGEVLLCRPRLENDTSAGSLHI